MDDKRIGELEKRLLEMKQELLELSQVSEEMRKPVTLDQQSVGRLSRMDALQDQAMQLETERRRQTTLQRIKAALGRISEGEFGYCLSCSEDIDDKRLVHDPSVAMCIKCAR